MGSFADGFLWGVAASAYQIEGGVDEGGRSPSIWDTFSHTPGKTARGETGDIAIDHYHRYAEDVSLMAELGVDSYRFSISWPRLIPDGVGGPNRAGIGFYRNLCHELSQHGITPLATLYHWDLPQVLQDEGGWTSPESVEWFAAYAATAQRELGDLIPIWTTHNEPWCAAFLGHGAGMFAPGVSDPAAAFTAAHHLMAAHHRAIETMRAEDGSAANRHGIVLNLIPARPGGDRPEDVQVASVANDIHNELFLQAALEGRYPSSIERLHDRFGVEVDVGDLSSTDIDLLGINYYNINRFTFSADSGGLGEFPGADGATWATPPGNLTEMGWGVEPEGLGMVLDDVALSLDTPF